MKPSGSDEVCEMYDSSADWYSEMMDSEIKLPIYSETLARLHKNIENLTGILIDTACGSGHMLSMYHEQYDPNRHLLGIDLSPQMVSITGHRLGSKVNVVTGDMRKLTSVDDASAAAVINFFALHHLDSEEAHVALREWYRVLQPGGQIVVATWEGVGFIDYGEESDIIAVKYSRDELVSITRKAGFNIDRCVVGPVEGFPMNAIYLDGTKE